jgi:hypothetical protein
LTAILLIAILVSAFISNRKQEKIMSAIEDLQAADAAETAEIATVGQALTDEVARVTAALSTLGQSTDPQVAAVALDLQTHVTNLQTIATALANVAPATPSAPTPAS